jgi:hypothetical protein
MDFTETARSMVEQGQISARAYSEVLTAYEKKELQQQHIPRGQWYTVVDGNLSYQIFEEWPRPQDEPYVAPWGTWDPARPALSVVVSEARKGTRGGEMKLLYRHYARMHSVQDAVPRKPSLLKRLANKIRQEVEE